jgi:hypothetical protein
MALSAPTLAELIRTNLEAAGFNTSSVGKDAVPWLLLWSEAVAEAVVTHITSSGKAVGTDSGGYTHSLDIQ